MKSVFTEVAVAVISRTTSAPHCEKCLDSVQNTSDPICLHVTLLRCGRYFDSYRAPEKMQVGLMHVLLLNINIDRQRTPQKIGLANCCRRKDLDLLFMKTFSWVEMLTH